MPLDLSRTLVVGISSTALFDLEEADQMFQELKAEDREKAIERYRRPRRDLRMSSTRDGQDRL